jgi:hypothetical protein
MIWHDFLIRNNEMKFEASFRSLFVSVKNHGDQNNWSNLWVIYLCLCNVLRSSSWILYNIYGWDHLVCNYFLHCIVHRRHVQIEMHPMYGCRNSKWLTLMHDENEMLYKRKMNFSNIPHILCVSSSSSLCPRSSRHKCVCWVMDLLQAVVGAPFTL